MPERMDDPMYSIIIVDDEDLITASLSKHIGKYHPDLQCKGTFSDGESVLNFLQTNSVDMIVTDILMPGMDGIEMIRRIRAIMPEVAIVIISSYSEFEYAQRAITYNVKNYLLKPIDFQEFSATLNDIAGKLRASALSANADDDSIQLFFIDLLSRVVRTRQEMEKHLSEFPMIQKEDKGSILSITFDTGFLQQWKNRMGIVYAALLNHLRMMLPRYQVFYLYKHFSSYFFVILSHDAVPELSCDALAAEIKNTMNWICTFQSHSVFLSMEDLLFSKTATLPAETYPLVENSEEDDVIIQKALSYIQTHFASDLSREDVAKAVFLTPSYFSRIFKQKTEMSFIRYLTQVRMDRAAELLKTQMNVSDIAAAVGYMHRNQYIINFREYSGYSPTEYRKKIIMQDAEQ